MLSFAAPWLLLAGLAIPLVWWLIRAGNPQEERQIFPPLEWLRHLSPPTQTPPRRRPWWLLLLRLGWLAILCVAAAHPFWTGEKIGPSLPTGPRLIVLDDGWASAADWQQRLMAVRAVLDQAERQDQSVALQTSAPGWDGQTAALLGPMPPSHLRPLLARLEPKPWSTQRQNIVPILGQVPQGPVIWISDGWADAGSDALLQLDKRLIVLRSPHRAVKLLGIEQHNNQEWVRGAPTDTDPEPEIEALDAQGTVLLRQSISQPLSLDGALRNRVSRIRISGQTSAAATLWLDGGWYRPQVGMVEEAPPATPLLSEAHYLVQALTGWADIRRGKVSSLLSESISVLLLPDSIPLSPSDQQAVLTWVRAGGVLIRFAGPHLGNKEPHHDSDPLLPLPVRPGIRWLGGSLSWTDPLPLGEFSPHGPLAGLPLAPDVVIRRQILADPSADSMTGHDQRLWARLQDGTPLVSGRREGQGHLVLLHVAAHPGWSTLPLSGLWLEMLHRLVDLGHPVAAQVPAESVSPPPADPLSQMPTQLMDGFGRLRPLPQPPPPDHIAGQRLAGRYGSRMMNVGPLLPDAIPLPPHSTDLDLRLGLQMDPAQDLRLPLFLLAACVWLVDCLLRLPGIRNTLPVLRLALLFCCLTGPALAEQSLRLALWQPAALSPQPAYEGLSRLSRVVRHRSSVPLDEPLLLTRLDEELLTTPLLYWPLDPSTPRLSAADVERLNHYMKVGGVLVIEAAVPDIRQILYHLAPGLVTSPLRRVDQQHVIARSFYLLRDDAVPLANGTILAADPLAESDGTSPLIIIDTPLSVQWQHESERSGWFRLGVNLVLYALTGTYKADQVHIPAMLERLGR